MSRDLSSDRVRPAALDLGELARGLRGSLASLRAATEALERFPGMEAEQRARLFGVVADESDRLGALVGRLEELSTGPGVTVADLDAAELVDLARVAISAPGLEVELSGAPPAGRLQADRDALTEAFRAFAGNLRRDFAAVRCTLGSEEVDDHLLVDWAWRSDPADVQRLQDWQGEALDATLRPAARSHGGEAWFDLDRAAEEDGRRAHVRVLLPMSAG